MFITFEGIDGSGKTTQLQRLRAALEKEKIEVVVTREPGGTALAEAIRNYLLHSTQALEARAELLLFGAARAQHLIEVIEPAIARGAWVLCDRFADSSLAYQGGGLSLNNDFIRQMNDFATNGLTPDLTFLLDIEPAAAQVRRADETQDRIEERGLQFQERVRAAYRKIADTEPERVMVLDGAWAADEIANEIWGLAREHLAV